MNIPRRTGVVVAIAVAIGVPMLAANAADSDSISATVSVGNPGDDRPFVDTADDTISLPDGSYEMVGYGTVLVVDGDQITPRHVTTSTCTEGEPFDNELPVDHADDDGGVITIDVVGSTTDYRLRPLLDLPGCDSGPEEALTALDEAFSTHYPFFAERGVDWRSSLSSIERDIEEGSASLPTALAGFLLELGDGHTLLEGLDVEIDVTAFGLEGDDTVAELGAALDAELDATLARLDELHVDASGNVAWGTFTSRPEIGYLYVGGFESGDDPVADREALITALDEAIGQLGESQGLVVDVRFNLGGYEDLAAITSGYFVDTPTEAYRKWAFAEPDPLVQTVVVKPQGARYDGEVVVLSSPVTASAAETFLLGIREVADATVVGLPSIGEFSDAIDWRLPDGTELTMSMEVYTDLDGTNHEAVGVPVDVTAPFDRTVDATLALRPADG